MKEEGSIMLSLVKSITQWKIWAFIASAFLVLLGLIKFEKYKNQKKDNEIDELKNEIELQGHNAEVKEFQSINLERKEKAGNEENSNTLNANTTYSV